MSSFPAAPSVLIASLFVVGKFWNGSIFCFVQLGNLAASVTFKNPSEQGCLAGTVLAVRVLISFLNHLAVTAEHCVISGNDKQGGVGEMSGSGERVEPNKQPSIDAATCTAQANELLRLLSVLTFTTAITLLQTACNHTQTLSLQLPWQQKKPVSGMV